MSAIARRRKILEFALASLLRRKYKNLSLIAVYAFTIAVLASILLLTYALRREAAAVLQGAPELIVQRMSAGRHDLIPAGYVERIAAIPGVGEVLPRIWGYYYDPLTKSNFTLMAADGTGRNPGMIEGRLPAGPGECAVGAGVAGARFSSIGSEMTLLDSGSISRTFRVVGIFTADSSLLTNDLILMHPDDLRSFFAFPPDRATDLIVQVHNENEVPTVAAKIRAMFPDSRPIMREEILRTYDAVFNWRSGMMLTIFLSALAAFCILAWDKATGISAEERREVGILKAVGWDTADILEMKFWEGLVISLTSFLTGLIAAYVHVFYFNASVLAPVIKGWSILFPGFRLIPFVDIYQIFVIGFLTVVPYIASTVFPSWKTATTDPDSVMRS